MIKKSDIAKGFAITLLGVTVLFSVISGFVMWPQYTFITVVALFLAWSVIGVTMAIAESIADKRERKEMKEEYDGKE